MARPPAPGTRAAHDGQRSTVLPRSNLHELTDFLEPVTPAHVAALKLLPWQPDRFVLAPWPSAEGGRAEVRPGSPLTLARRPGGLRPCGGGPSGGMSCRTSRRASTPTAVGRCPGSTGRQGRRRVDLTRGCQRRHLSLARQARDLAATRGPDLPALARRPGPARPARPPSTRPRQPADGTSRSPDRAWPACGPGWSAVGSWAADVPAAVRTSHSRSSQLPTGWPRARPVSSESMTWQAPTRLRRSLRRAPTARCPRWPEQQCWLDAAA
jgi:hypothetical protein